MGEKLRFLDLFAGIGGFRLALELAGHKCVGFCEIDEFARQIYKTNFDTEGEVDWEDITEVTDSEARELRGKVDLITAGFPCQAFSVAGKRRGFEDTRGTMFFEIARIAKEIEPRFLLLENVKGLLSHDKGRTFAIILSTLDELGYDVEWQVLNSKDFGVPQNRERVFIVGHSRRFPRREVFPITRSSGQALTELTRGLADAYRVYDPAGVARTLKAEAGGMGAKIGLYAVRNLGNIYPSGGQNGEVYDPKGLSPTLRSGQGVKGRGIGSNNSPKIAVPVLTPDGVEKRQNGRRFKEPGGPTFTSTSQDRHGVLVGQRTGVKEVEVGYTLAANYYKGLGGNQERTGVVEGVRIRRLTPLECFRLQGFPDEFFHRAKAAGVSDSQLYKQAGNAVTVNVVYEIARRFQND